MLKSEELPRWMKGRKPGKRIVLNEHNGLATQGLLESGRGAIAFWKVSGYSPSEDRIMVFVRLTDGEAQAVFDADPNTHSFLEPVWRTISDNRVVVDVRDVEGRHGLSAVTISRTANVSAFMEDIRRTARRALTPEPWSPLGRLYGIKLVETSGRDQVLRVEKPKKLRAERNLVIAKQLAKKKAKRKTVTRAGSDFL